ncbi:MAG: helix-turn-helix transcriptional regulator [Streptosporangiaceae bacterium]|nr:helix-turn-helix transcriptional regulator [Streptosporangiaceae bacterium]
MPAARTCPACRTASPSRPGDPLCPACTRAARQAVPCPLWPFDSLLMRRVLAEVNAPAVVAVFRAATGLSQTDVAAMAGWSRAALSYYEHGQRGAVFDIRVLLGFTDAVAMPREALLPLVLGDTGEMDTEVDRRSFTGLAAGAALAAMLPEAAVPSRVTASHVKYLQASLGTLWTREGLAGGRAILPPALRQWQLAQRMLRHSSYIETVGRQLLIAAGYLADVSAWAAYDAADLSLARRLYIDALDLATSAGDSALTGWVLQNYANLCCYQASHTASVDWDSRDAARQAVSLSDRAIEEARYEPAPWLQVRIALRHADAASLTGNPAGFRSAIARAQRELDRAPGIEEPQWVKGFTVGPDLITTAQATGAANLGDLPGAETVYQELLARRLLPRTRVFLGARLAGVQLAQNAQRDALATGRAVLDMVEGGVTSTRTLNELRPVRAAAGESGDEEFCARFDAAERALSAA